jgi:ABC-type polar amino acid transport system ATPase subunit
MEEPLFNEKTSSLDPELVPLIQKLESVFRSNVKIKPRGTRGEIILTYESLESLDYIMKVVDGGNF